MASKMPSSACEIALLVAVDQFGKIEIVAGIGLHALRQTPPHAHFLVLVQERQLDAVDLAGVVGDDVDADIHRRDVIGFAPIALQRRIEHFAEPMDDQRLAHLFENAAINLGVIVGRLGGDDQCAARHQDDAAAAGFDRLDLFLIGADDVVDGGRRGRNELVGADAGINGRARHVARRFDRELDELQRVRPVEPHAALRGVHGFGDAEAERPEMAAIGDGGVPVDRGGQPGIHIGERIGDQMRGGERDAIEFRGGAIAVRRLAIPGFGPCSR